jgi:heme-degrading monooxygenase HmoA
MTTVVTVRFQVDPGQFLKTITQDTPRLIAIAEDAKQYGVLSHRFVAGDNEVLAIDEWQSRAAFDAFFSGPSQRLIEAMMTEAGVTTPPVVAFYESLETPDRVTML